MLVFPVGIYWNMGFPPMQQQLSIEKAKRKEEQLSGKEYMALRVKRNSHFLRESLDVQKGINIKGRNDQM